MGDDAAVLANGLLAATDTMVAGVDWRDEWSAPSDVGWKAIMVNASDIAAMGGSPRWFLVSVVAAAGFDVDALYDGVVEAVEACEGAVVGGDLSSGPTTVVTVAVLGHADRPVRRDGASTGDALWVSAPLGAAGAELRGLAAGHAVRGSAHRRPVARVEAGLVAARAGATAMIDVSDGFVADANHVARESRLRLAFDDVPVAPGATRGDALYGGDDYELIAAAPPGAALTGWIRVGACEAGEPAVTVGGFLVDPHGWEHEL